MINGNGLFTKSAMTRANNNEVQARQATMPHNQMAQRALRKQFSKKNKGGDPPVGQQRNNILEQVPSVQPVRNPVPTGGPQGASPPVRGSQSPDFSGEGFDPAVFAQQSLDAIVGDIRTEQFMESPRVKDAMTSLRFKNIMNSNNSSHIPDSRNLFQQVVDRIGM